MFIPCFKIVTPNTSPLIPTGAGGNGQPSAPLRAPSSGQRNFHALFSRPARKLDQERTMRCLAGTGKRAGRAQPMTAVPCLQPGCVERTALPPDRPIRNDPLPPSGNSPIRLTRRTLLLGVSGGSDFRRFSRKLVNKGLLPPASDRSIPHPLYFWSFIEQYLCQGMIKASRKAMTGPS